ncbi:hypothetical protein IG631_11644 [Alternaria alternata]|nr:hypothetical protein IG631_11644 [Alternaria alternata]
MDKRNRSQSRAQARKCYASATPISSFTSSQKTIASDSNSDTEEKASTLGSSEQPSRMRSSSFDSGFTSSQLANDTDNSLSPDRSHQRRPGPLEGLLIHTPPAVATFAGMVTKGSLTPSIDHETSNNGTMVHTPTISPHAADGFQHPPFTSLGNDAPKDIFPNFETGNVFIETELVTPPKQWRLHSNVLARFSSWFARALSSMAATAVGATWATYIIEEADGKILLIQQQATGERPVIRDTRSDIPRGIAIKVETEDSDSKAVPGITPDRTTIIDICNQVFSAFYNVEMDILTTNIAASINHC